MGQAPMAVHTSNVPIYEDSLYFGVLTLSSPAVSWDLAVGLWQLRTGILIKTPSVLTHCHDPVM